MRERERERERKRERERQRQTDREMIKHIVSISDILRLVFINSLKNQFTVGLRKIREYLPMYSCKVKTYARRLSLA